MQWKLEELRQQLQYGCGRGLMSAMRVGRAGTGTATTTITVIILPLLSARMLRVRPGWAGVCETGCHGPSCSGSLERKVRPLVPMITQAEPNRPSRTCAQPLDFHHTSLVDHGCFGFVSRTLDSDALTHSISYRLLPQPVHASVVSDDEDDVRPQGPSAAAQSSTAVVTRTVRPPYGQRSSWKPTSQEDFGELLGKNAS